MQMVFIIISEIQSSNTENFSPHKGQNAPQLLAAHAVRQTFYQLHEDHAQIHPHVTYILVLAHAAYRVSTVNIEAKSQTREALQGVPTDVHVYTNLYTTTSSASNCKQSSVYSLARRKLTTVWVYHPYCDVTNSHDMQANMISRPTKY